MTSNTSRRIAVPLLVTGEVLQNPETARAVKTALHKFQFTRTMGIQLMTVHTTDADAIAETITAIACARKYGLTVEGVFDDPVNLGEITRRVGKFSREAIRKWSEEVTFPVKRGSTGGDRPSPTYYWADVAQWLLTQKHLDMGENLPDAKTVAAINAHIHGVQDVESIYMHHAVKVATATPFPAVTNWKVVVGTTDVVVFGKTPVHA
jgi:hypothetical protein